MPDSFKHRAGEPLSEAELEQRALAPRTHGMYSKDWGDVTRLRELVATQPGRIQLREDLTVALARLVAQGYAYLETEQGVVHKLNGDGPLKYLGWTSNLLARLLRDWPSPIDEALRVGELERLEEVLEKSRE